MVILFVLFLISANKDYAMLGLFSFFLMAVDVLYIIYTAINRCRQKNAKVEVSAENLLNSAFVVRSDDGTFRKECKATSAVNKY